MSNVFPLLSSYHESRVRAAVSVRKTFVGPDVLEEWELVRQVRDYFVIKREQRELRSIHDNSVQNQKALALKCSEVIAKYHVGLLPSGSEVPTPMLAVFAFPVFV